jgi:hypothetical protein
MADGPPPALLSSDTMAVTSASQTTSDSTKALPNIFQNGDRFEDIDFNAKTIARHHRLAKFCPVNASQIDERLRRRPQRFEGQESADLRHRFHDQDTGHDRPSREMSLEERLIYRHVLDADYPTIRFEFEDTVDEQKRITMR